MYKDKKNYTSRSFIKETLDLNTVHHIYSSVHKTIVLGFNTSHCLGNVPMLTPGRKARPEGAAEIKPTIVFKTKFLVHAKFVAMLLS